jgi:hypothetical protein
MFNEITINTCICIRSEIKTVEGMFRVEKWLYKVIKLLTGVTATPFWIWNENGFKKWYGMLGYTLWSSKERYELI